MQALFALINTYYYHVSQLVTLQALVGAGGQPGGGHEQVLQVPGGVGQAQRDGGDSDQQEADLLIIC